MTIVWSGLSVGAVYALIAMGYNITHLTAGVFNFAHAHLIAIGLFVAYWGLVERHIPQVVVFVVSGLLVMVVAAVEHEVAIRPLRGASAHAELVTVIGVATVITGLLIKIYGSDAKIVPAPFSDDPGTYLGGRAQPSDLILIAVTLVLGAALHLAARRTRIGLAALAREADDEMAQLRGINARMLSLGGYMLSGLLAGLLGPLIVAKTFASTSLPMNLAIIAFVVLVLGGVGSFYGSLIGGFFIGLAEAFGGRYIGTEYRDTIIFAIFIVVLMVRPQGLFGERKVRAV